MSPRRDFIFSQEETEYLDKNFLSWEAVNDIGMHWLLIHEFHIPDGFTVSSVTVAINIPLSYPDACLDMAYFHPHLKRADENTIRCTESMKTIEGNSYQRWSRHYTGDKSYVPSVDSIITHIMAIRGWLQREVK